MRRAQQGQYPVLSTERSVWRQYRVGHVVTTCAVAVYYCIQEQSLERSRQRRLGHSSSGRPCAVCRPGFSFFFLMFVERI